MLLLEHSAIRLTCHKLPFVIKPFILSIFEWPLKTGLLYPILKESAYKIYCRCLSANRFLVKCSPRKRHTEFRPFIKVYLYCIPLVVDKLLIVTPIVGFCNCSLRELVALLSLSSWCPVSVVWLFLAMPWVCLQSVIVLFPDLTHLLFFLLKRA